MRIIQKPLGNGIKIYFQEQKLKSIQSFYIIAYLTFLKNPPKKDIYFDTLKN